MKFFCYTYSIQRQAADNYVAIQLESVKNKCELVAKLAECCCEIKESILSSANTTQGIIRENESNRLRDALQNSTTENLILRLSNANGNGKS